MSHVVKIKLEIKDLAALKEACKAMGLEFRENQKSYRWFGQFMGDYPLAAGFSQEDLGKCEHAIGIPGRADAYEVGIVRRRDGKAGYELMWDFWAGGNGLQDAIGENGNKLRQEYAAATAARIYRQQGYRVTRTIKDGRIVMQATR